MHTRYHMNYFAVILLAVTAVAAAENEDEIARCARISSLEDRILCLEEALRQPYTEDESASAAPVADERAMPSESLPAETKESGNVGIRPAAPTAKEDSIAMAPGPEVPQKSTPPEIVAEAGTETTAAGITSDAQHADQSAARGINEFGLSQSQRNPDSLDSINVRVVSIENDPYGKLIFVTESGQVWHQIDRSTPRYRQMPFEAEIRQGAVGSFFIKPLSGGVAVRVKRNR